MRTAILPFVFLLNPRFLLMDISTPLDLFIVVTSGMLGMTAFTAGARGWLLRATSHLERGLLFGAAFLLLFATTPVLLVTGTAAFCIVLFLQK